MGAASGVGGRGEGSGDGPVALEQSDLFQNIVGKGRTLHWQAMISTRRDEDVLDDVASWCEGIASETLDLVEQKKFFLTLGGDHACAIGTWSGGKAGLPDDTRMGMIWIDAHMDAHTFDTSPSGNIHGMPVAALLGHGDDRLVEMAGVAPKIAPDAICQIGVRSYEDGEEALLKKLGVRVYLMDEVKQRGFQTCFEEALAKVQKNSDVFGISIDLDGFDPKDAPAVDVPEPDGLLAKDVLPVLQKLRGQKNLIGLEVVEFNPHKDIDQKTERLVCDIVDAIIGTGEKA